MSNVFQMPPLRHGEVSYVIYETATGAVVQFGNAPEEDLPFLATPGREPMLGSVSSVDTHYVENGELLERTLPPIVADKTIIAADSGDTATLTGLPDPCAVLIDGSGYYLEGGVLTLQADVPATYTVEVIQFPYLPFSIEIEAV